MLTMHYYIDRHGPLDCNHSFRMVHCPCYILLLSLLTTVITSYKDKGKNYTLYRLVSLTKKDRQILYIIHKNYVHCHFLNGITNEAAIPMHIAVEEEYVVPFEQLLNNTDALFTKYQHFRYVPITWRDAWRPKELVDDDLVYDNFLDFSTMQNLYKYWETKYPKTFQKLVIGKTYEDREIILLKVSVIPSIRKQRSPAVFFLGGEEGRDWISPAVLLSYMKNLLEGTLNIWTTGFDAYFVPLLNPDGYSYSISTDRFWAKNRKIIEPKIMCHPPNIAKGVNIDRNWVYKPKGEKACDKMYFGRYLSEYETYNLSEYLDRLAPQTLAFFNIKGFDNLITTPYARKEREQHNFETVKEILRHTCQYMDATFNKSYYYGTTGNLLFNYTGNSADWVKRNLNVPMVATFYVKHEDNVIPSNTDIRPLYIQFATGINEIISITTDLYGPLFNSQGREMYNISFIFINVYFIFCWAYVDYA